MCQQWLRVAGLVFDIIGVVMIVTEWHIMFRRHVEGRRAEIAAINSRWARRMNEERSLRCTKSYP
jgi:hypothetical protein